MRSIIVKSLIKIFTSSIGLRFNITLILTFGSALSIATVSEVTREQALEIQFVPRLISDKNDLHSNGDGSNTRYYSKVVGIYFSNGNQKVMDLFSCELSDSHDQIDNFLNKADKDKRNSPLTVSTLQGSQIHICYPSRILKRLYPTSAVEISMVELNGRIGLRLSTILTGFVYYVEKIEDNRIYISDLVGVLP